MTTYVQKKSRVFKEAGEPQPLLPKRSEGRLKRYPSATDARAWTVENEPRRQHILEMLLQKPGGLNVGRYIPLEVLINTLLANKDADIERLKKQLEELQKLLQAYENLELTPEQKNQLKKMKEKLGVASDSLSSKGGEGGESSKRSGPGSETGGAPPPTEASEDLMVLRMGLTDKETECAANQASPGVPPCQSVTMEDLEGLSPEELKKIIIKKDQEILNLRNALAGQLVGDPNKEVGDIDDEIERLRKQGKLTPEKEIELLRKQIEVLKRCCANVPALKSENEELRKQLGLGDTEGTLGDMKQKAQEADDLYKKNQELQRQLAAARAKFGDDITASQVQLASVKKQMDCKCKELEALRAERESLHKKLCECENQEQETERLRYRVKETEVLRIERDRLKMRLDELSNIEMEFMDLLDKTKGFDSVRAERDAFKAKYEELLCVECEVEMLRSQLDASRTIVDEKNALERQVCDLECCLADQECEINRLVEHIESLAQGRDDQQSLDFEELEYMHSKICDATASLLNNQSGKTSVRPAETDKYLLMKRNMSLERSLVGNKQESQSAVTKLEQDINMERQRLEDLRKHLEREKHTNNELLQRLRMQTKAVSNLQVERELLRKKSSLHDEKLQRYVGAIEQEKARVRDLEIELDNERTNVKRLKNLLNMERENSRSSKKRDSQQLDNLRTELEQSVSSDMKLRMQIEQTFPKSKQRSSCTSPCTTGKRPIHSAPLHPNSTSFYTELTVGEKNQKQRCPAAKRDIHQRPNKEYED